MRRGLVVPWLASVVAIPALVAGIEVAVMKDGIESDLARRSSAALNGAGFAGIGVRFDGRDATLSGVPARADSRAVAAVTTVNGVRVVQVAPRAQHAAAIELSRGGDTISVAARVPDHAAREQLVGVVKAKAGHRAVEDLVSVHPGTGGLDLGAVGSLAATLAGAEGVWAISYDGTTATLSGAVPSGAARPAAAAAVTRALPGVTVDNQLTVARDAAAELQARIDAVLEAAPIRFSTGGHALNDRSLRSIRAVAGLLNASPSARALVAGHTDNDGSKAVSRPLSERRAAAVIAELVQLGVGANRLEGRGYGEDRPIASNDTAPGRAANRRVEISVLSGGTS